MSAKKIAVAIVDDHTLFRQGLASILTESDEIDVIFDAGDGNEMVRKLATTNTLPDVILMDITMPGMDGYESTRWVKNNYPQIKVLALSMFEDDGPIIGMLTQGAGGYMLKHSKAADLVTAIKSIDRYAYFINDLVSGKLLTNIQNNHPAKAHSAVKLNANEQKFLQLCCSDLTYKEIADQMNLSPHTINNYREALFDRFETKSRTGLVITALKNQLIKLS